MTTKKDTSQKQKFIDAAREHGCDESEEAFKETLKALSKPKKEKPKK